MSFQSRWMAGSKRRYFYLPIILILVAIFVVASLKLLSTLNTRDCSGIREGERKEMAAHLAQLAPLFGLERAEREVARECHELNTYVATISGRRMKAPQAGLIVSKLEGEGWRKIPQHPTDASPATGDIYMHRTTLTGHDLSLLAFVNRQQVEISLLTSAPDRTPGCLCQRVRKPYVIGQPVHRCRGFWRRSAGREPRRSCVP